MKKKRYFVICCFPLTSTKIFHFLLSNWAFNHLPLLFVVGNRKTRDENVRETEHNCLTLPRARGGDLDLSTVLEISFLSVFS